ncbi:putative integral membrane protein [Leishmania donovani]|nr:putative integral membrane protein [Leishmania donovani]
MGDARGADANCMNFGTGHQYQKPHWHPPVARKTDAAASALEMNTTALVQMWALVAVALSITAAQVASADSKTYVAPHPTVGLSSKDEEYLIGVVSFAAVVVACFMGIASMVKIDYDDDTLLMVEVLGDINHEKE